MKQQWLWLSLLSLGTMFISLNWLYTSRLTDHLQPQPWTDALMEEQVHPGLLTYNDDGDDDDDDVVVEMFVGHGNLFAGDGAQQSVLDLTDDSLLNLLINSHNQ